MIHYVNSCEFCPFLDYQGGGCSKCKHPKSNIGFIYDENIKETIHSDCPLKTVDLILTIRERC